MPTWPHPLTTLALLLLALLLVGLLRQLFGVATPAPTKTKPSKPKTPRPLRPHTPDDCPACSGTPPPPPVNTTATVPPWHTRKSRRGRPKRIETEGHGCPNPACRYYNLTDANIHALVGYGHHGADHIQDLYCQACHHKVTARRHTPLYRLKTSAHQVARVLTALAEGLSIAGAAHTFAHSEPTIATWLNRAGSHAERLHERFFRNLHLRQVQLDELRTTLRTQGTELWVWLAFDVQTKTIAAATFGPRTQALAQTLIHALVRTLAPGRVPLFTSDGLDLYGYALTAHFGQWVEIAGRVKRQWVVAKELCYGQVLKKYRHRRIVRVERRIRWGTSEEFNAKREAYGLDRVLNTAFVERVNLTLRRGLAALQRRSGSTFQTANHLEQHFQWWRGYYHFIRPHRSLRQRLLLAEQPRGKRPPRRYRPQTPAMAVGVTAHRWTVVEFLSLPVTG
jgi:IS1 family transposase/transposase-like protein